MADKIDTDALEAMVDQIGLDGVLYALANIAGFKAYHMLEKCQQDEELARSWQRDAATVEKCGDDVEN